MIKQTFHIDNEDWDVIAFYAVTHLDVEEIMHCLELAGCTGDNSDRAYKNLSKGANNTGLCYSGNHISVLVVSVTSSPQQFFNSLAHEIHHLSTHIADEVGYDYKSEEVCYLAGEIAENMFYIASKFLCEHCR